MGIFLISGNDGSVPKARIKFCLCDESDNCESFVGEILFCGCCLLCEIGTLRGEIGPIERKGSVGSLKRLTRISVAPAAISGARPFGFCPRIPPSVLLSKSVPSSQRTSSANDKVPLLPMDRSDHRIKQEQRNYEDKRRMNGDYHPLRSPSQTHVATDRMEGIQIPGYTLMVAGRPTGKTSFLRLLLDTSIISPLASREQLDSVAKFVYGSSGHTSHIRSMSVIIDLANPDSDQREPLMLTLIDTPSLEIQDDASSRTVSEIMRHVEARFSESVEDVSVSRSLSLLSLSNPFLYDRNIKPGQEIIMCTCKHVLCLPITASFNIPLTLFYPPQKMCILFRSGRRRPAPRFAPSCVRGPPCTHK